MKDIQTTHCHLSFLEPHFHNHQKETLIILGVLWGSNKLIIKSNVTEFTVVSILYFQLIESTTIFLGRDYYYSHFKDKKTEASVN